METNGPAFSEVRGKSSKISLACIVRAIDPDEQWMNQIARNETMVDFGFLEGNKKPESHLSEEEQTKRRLANVLRELRDRRPAQ